MTTTEESVFTKYLILSWHMIDKEYIYSHHDLISNLKCNIWIYCMLIYQLKLYFQILFIPYVVPALWFHWSWLLKYLVFFCPYRQAHIWYGNSYALSDSVKWMFDRNVSFRCTMSLISFILVFISVVICTNNRGTVAESGIVTKIYNATIN